MSEPRPRTSVVSGDASLSLGGGGVYPLMQSGQLRALAVASREPIDELPGVPSVSEFYPSYEMSSWQGLFVPAGTPQSVIDTLSAAFKTISEQPETRKLIEQQGMNAIYYGPTEAAKFWNGEIDKWEAVVKAAGLVTQ